MIKSKFYLLFLVVFGVLMISTTTVSAHGYVESPASRSYQGSLEKNTLGYSAALAKYGAVINEPQSLEYRKGFPEQGPKDGRIASANGILGDTILDLQTADRWKKTNISTGVNSFTWKYFAYHSTAKWHYYITKQGWDPNQPLARADLELIGTIAGNGAIPTDNTPHQITIPQNRQGYHVIVAVWDVADTQNAFYSVIDVNVVPSTGVSTPPSIPTGLSASTITSSSAKISWAPQSDATSYLVFRNEQSVKEVSTTEFQDQGLSPNTDYAYKIQAKGTSGLTSAKSEALIVRTTNVDAIEKPTAPKGLHSMEITVNSVSLMWAASTHSQGIKRYEILRNGVKIAETTQTSYLNTGLMANTSYRYTVKAVAQNDQVSDASNELTVKTKTSVDVAEKPTTPTSLQSMEVTANSVSLMWSVSTHSQGIKRYDVFRNDTKIAEVTQSNYINTGLAANTEYKYTVKAVSQNDQVSDASNELTVRTKNIEISNGQTYCGAEVYNPEKAYPTANTKVFYSCRIWINKWYVNPNELPGTNLAWEEVSVCAEGPDCKDNQPVTYCGAREYNPTKAYTTADTKVFYNCKIWKNKWYANPGEMPGQNDVWEFVSNCNENPDCAAATASNRLSQDNNISVVVANNIVNFSPESSYGRIREIQIFNALGNKVLSSVKPTKDSINISALPSGIYFIRILYTDGGSVTKTIRK